MKEKICERLTKCTANYADNYRAFRWNDSLSALKDTTRLVIGDPPESTFELTRSGWMTIGKLLDLTRRNKTSERKDDMHLLGSEGPNYLFHKGQKLLGCRGAQVYCVQHPNVHL